MSADADPAFGDDGAGAAAAAAPDADSATQEPDDVGDAPATDAPDAAAAEADAPDADAPSTDASIAGASDAPTPDAPEPAAPAAPDAGALAAQVAALTADLASAQRRADDALMVARRQSEMADELHGENRRLREGEVREAVAPLIRGLARLADDLSRMAGPDGQQAEDVAFIDARVQELLHDAGVVAVRPVPGEPFDPRVHQATGSATTSDPAADRTIAELRRAGLQRDDGRMLRPADVVVHRFAPVAQAAAAAPENGTTNDPTEGAS